MKWITTARAARPLLLGLAALVAFTGPAQAAQTKQLELHQKNDLPFTASEFSPRQSHEQCPTVPDGMDGWHFVIPADAKVAEFVSLQVTFNPGGTQTITTFGPPSNKHAYAASAAGATLTAATAVIEGESDALERIDFFNLSHTCPATGPGTNPSPQPSATVPTSAPTITTNPSAPTTTTNPSAPQAPAPTPVTGDLPVTG